VRLKCSPTGEGALTRLPEFPDFYWQDFYNLLIIEEFRDLAWNIGMMG
jgi:hypothetical protein